jgi:hypothetical protein
MHMTFEKIEKIEKIEKEEHPAYKAARLIMNLHQDNIAKIDSGFVFLRDGVDVSATIRAESVKQIGLCEAIMARAVNMGELHRDQAQSILEEFSGIIEEAKSSPDGLAQIPEIGNYDHGK